MQGPLQLAPVIQGALQEAQGLSGMQTAGAGLRIMLVILSDDPFDLAQVQEEVKAAQEQPLVILVVGIGTSGFHEMEVSYICHGYPPRCLASMSTIGQL